MPQHINVFTQIANETGGGVGTLREACQWIKDGDGNDILDFSAGDSYVNLNDSYSTAQSAITVEAWFKTTPQDYGILISYDRNEYFRIETGGNSSAANDRVGVAFMTSAGQVDGFDSTSVVADDTWHHIAFVYDNGTAYLYIDGVQENTTTSGTTLGSGIVRYGMFGANSEATTSTDTPPNSDRYPGQLYDVRIWNTARTQTQIQNNMDTAFTGGESNLVALWREPSGAIWKEVSAPYARLNTASHDRYPKGQLPGNYVDRALPVYFKCTVTIPDDLADGTLFNLGADGIGCWVGLINSNFRVGAGDGGTTTESVETAILDYSGIGSYAGQQVVLEWDFEPSAGQVRLWIDGSLIDTKTTTDTSAFEGSKWAGTNAGGYGIAYDSVPNFGVNADWQGSVDSPLEVYRNALKDTVSLTTVWKSANAYVKDAGVWKQYNTVINYGGSFQTSYGTLYSTEDPNGIPTETGRDDAVGNSDIDVGYLSTVSGVYSLHPSETSGGWGDIPTGSGTNTYSLTSNAGLDRWMMLRLREGSYVTDTIWGDLEIHFANGTFRSIKNAIDNGYIEPLVIMASYGKTGTNADPIPSFLNLYDNSANTGEGHWPQSHIIFKNKDVSQVQGWRAFSNRQMNGDNGNDGWAWYVDDNVEISVDPF